MMKDREYIFRDLTPVDATASQPKPDEGFRFADFDSVKAGWWLTEREAPSPDEQEITESVPYRQGKYDFSMLDNERFFDNRELTYHLLYVGEYYYFRKGFEQELKRQLMPKGWQRLYDTHEPVYYWYAKCKSVEVSDDNEYDKLEATITFEAYPFAYTLHNEGADYWDDVFFPHWLWQPVKFEVNGSRDITLKNIGSRPVLASFSLSGSVTIKSSSETVELTQDNYKATQIVLDIGDNRFTLSGSGTIEFIFKREELV